MFVFLKKKNFPKQINKKNEIKKKKLYYLNGKEMIKNNAKRKYYRSMAILIDVNSFSLTFLY